MDCRSTTRNVGRPADAGEAAAAAELATHYLLALRKTAGMRACLRGSPHARPFRESAAKREARSLALRVTSVDDRSPTMALHEARGASRPSIRNSHRSLRRILRASAGERS